MRHLRTIALALGAVLALARGASAQITPTAASITGTTCPGVGCMIMSTNNHASIAFQISGTWVGTLQFEQTLDESTWYSLPVFPYNSTTSVTSTTANGYWVASVAGVWKIRVRASAFVSGTASVYQWQAEAKSTAPGLGGFAAACGSSDGILYGSTGACSTALKWDNPSALEVATTNADPNVGFGLYLHGTVLQPGAMTGAQPYWQYMSYSTGGNTLNYLDGFYTVMDYTGGATSVTQSVTGSYLSALHESGTTPQFNAVQAVAETHGGTVTNATAVYGQVALFSGAPTNAWAFYAQFYPTTAAATSSAVSFYASDLAAGPIASANAYSFWSDEQGVFRIRSDHTFNSVYQAIPALYNPQYAKYIPGAGFHERGIPGQWESNVYVLTTEAGTTKTLTSVTSSGTTATATLTGLVPPNGAVVTIAGANQANYNGTFTITRVNDNSFTYTCSAACGTSPATGTITAQGGTLRAMRIGDTGVQVQVNSLSLSGASPSVANVGANSCGTTAASIAGNDNIGAVTVGATSATQCRITFTVAAANRRHCTVTDETTAGVAATLHATYVDTTHTDILGTITAGDVITYSCFAR